MYFYNPKILISFAILVLDLTNWAMNQAEAYLPVTAAGPKFVGGVQIFLAKKLKFI